MIYISHLLPDHEMNEIIEQTGVGIESIEFSIADNLDHLNDSIGSYRERLKFMDCRGLTLHGPFMNIDPAAFDSEVRKITMMRFHQTYTAGMELGAKKIIYHTCMNPYVHYLQGWPERVAEFFGEFLEKHKELEVVMENVFDPQIDPVLDVYKLLGEKYPNAGWAVLSTTAFCTVGTVGKFMSATHIGIQSIPSFSVAAAKYS